MQGTMGMIRARMAALTVLLMMPLVLSAQVFTVGHVFDMDHLLAYLVAGMLIALFVLVFWNRLFYYKEQETKSNGLSQNARLALVLKSGNLSLWLYNPDNRHYVTLSDRGEYAQEYNPVEFSKLFDRDDFEVLRSAVFDVCDSKRLTSTVLVRGCADAKGFQCRYEVNLSVASRNAKGKITRLLGIQRDVTDEYEKKEAVKQLLIRYHTVFNSSLMDMAFYDSQGVLRDINEKACHTFRITDREQVLNGHRMLADSPLFDTLDYEHMDSTRTTSVVYFDKEGGEPGEREKVYYESTINAIRNAQGVLEGIYMAGRDVTEMVESFHRQQEGAKRLRQATRNIEDYISNINYALRVSDVRLVNYYPASYTLELSDNVNRTQMRLSQLRCIRLASPRFRRNVSSMLNRMDHLTRYNVTDTIETEIRDSKGRQIWLLFNMVPLLDEEGKVERYFGICRNMTEMVETEQRLAVETKKAQETELLKQSFLTNMSYEIRTPLNTVVGFAELFESEHDPEDEPLFVEEIKKNSNKLLRLVNDILFISRLDANMIDHTPGDIDFALLFESHCQMGWSSVRPTVKTIVENPYTSLVVSIDHANLGQVIEKICSIASRFTEEGVIHAKYEYRRGSLIICVEDTGTGIDADTLPHIFERFVRDSQERLCGTGLDLPIIQLQVQQMGGSIEIESEKDKGTTVWITIPCEAKSMERRRDMMLNSQEPSLLL